MIHQEGNVILGATNMQNKGHFDKATFFYQDHLGLSDGPPFYCSLDLIHLVRGAGLLTFICLYGAFFEVYTNTRKGQIFVNSLFTNKSKDIK